MRVLLLGGTGFVGREVWRILKERGHEVTAPSRQELNFLKPEKSALFAGHDAVINTVGLMSRKSEILEQIHHFTPVQLAQWAEEAGVKTWVQLSALGADVAQKSAFVSSKARGDEALLKLNLTVKIARPSLIFGANGTSSRLFFQLARLPFLFLPNGGKGLVQPVAVWEVAEALVLLAEGKNSPPIIHMVGASRHLFRDYLLLIRKLKYNKSGKIFNLPTVLLRPFLPLTNILSNGFLSASNLDLLDEGSIADEKELTQILGRRPLGAEEFLMMK